MRKASQDIWSYQLVLSYISICLFFFSQIIQLPHPLLCQLQVSKQWRNLPLTPFGHWAETPVQTLKMMAKYSTCVFWVLWISKAAPLLNSLHLPFSLTFPMLSQVSETWFTFSTVNSFLISEVGKGEMYPYLVLKHGRLSQKKQKNKVDSTLTSSLRSLRFISSLSSSEIFTCQLLMASTHSLLWNSL